MHSGCAAQGTRCTYSAKRSSRGVDRRELHGRAGRLLAQPFQPRVVRSQQRRRRLKGDQVHAHGGFHPIQTSTATTSSSPARIGGTGLARLISLMGKAPERSQVFLESRHRPLDEIAKAQDKRHEDRRGMQRPRRDQVQEDRQGQHRAEHGFEMMV